MNNRVLIILGITVITVLTVGLFRYWTPEKLDRTSPLISDEVNRYLVMDFVPKYHVNECVVRFALHLKNKSDNYLRDVNLAFHRYINAHEPNIGAMIYLNWKVPDHYVYFADQCNRRDEIFAGMAANVEKHFGDRMRVERLALEEQVEPFGNMWLDSPGYSPDRVMIMHRAVRRDGKAFLQLVDRLETGDPTIRHVFYALAEHYLPPSELKTQAKQAKEELQRDFDTERLKRQQAVIQDWISKIERYNAH